jgi:hypothetical protein
MTAFACEPLDSGINWWDQATDFPPDETQEDRRAGTRIQSAQFEGGILKLAVVRGTIEWGFLVPEPMFGENPGVPLGQHLEPFRQIVHRWMEDCPGLSRMAFGSILRLPVATREAGYEQISNYLNFDLDPQSFDFNYQINRPRRSVLAGPDLKINRLTRWSVGRNIRIAIEGGQVRQELQTPYCRVELDINTDAEHVGPLPAQLLHQLYDELIGMGREIVQEGDVS